MYVSFYVCAYICIEFLCEHLCVEMDVCVCVCICIHLYISMYMYHVFDSHLFFLCRSIIYQRGIYPSDQFGKVKKYGLTLLMAQDENVKKFITGVTTQLSGILSSIAKYITNSWKRDP